MKTLFVSFIFLLAFSNSHAQWSWQNPLPQGNTLNDGFFISNSLGWVVGDVGTILKTTNGGVTWTSQSSRSINNLYAVCFYEMNTGTAIGDDGTILKTTNGGEDWNLQTSGTANILKGISFTDLNSGTSVGNNGVILRTSDGGINWIEQMSEQIEDLNDVMFINTNIGFTVGNSGTILKTTNGGNNWIEQTSGTKAILSGVSFSDTITGTVVGEGIILRTTNGGISWINQSNLLALNLSTNPNLEKNKVKSLKKSESNYRDIIIGNSKILLSVESIRSSDFLRDVSFVDANFGTIVGDYGIILTTTNGGMDWSYQFNETESDLYGVCFTDSNTGTATGFNGTILRTTNGGTDWIAESSGSIIHFVGADFVDANNGLAVGESVTANSQILRTTNGGSNWFEQDDGTNTENLWDVSMIDANISTAVGDKGTIIRTTNGSDWFEQTSGKTQAFWSVFFTDVNTGTVVGDWDPDASILHTTNGGNGWFEQAIGISYGLTGVYFIDTNTGTAVGGSTIIRTTNGGNDWIEQTSGTTGLWSVYFSNTNTGTSVGGAGKIIRTTNGGADWTSQSSGTYNDLFGVCFADILNGMVVGRNGTILRTTNGGADWIPQSSGTEYDLFAVSYNDDYSWTVFGMYGTILKFFDNLQSINVISPNGGQWWKTGWNRDITWSSENVANVNLYYSSDNGTNWNPIASNIAAAAGTYEWEIPLLNNFIESSCKIKIEEASNNFNYDVNDYPFNIWHPWGVDKACNLGPQVVDFLETNIDISLDVTSAGDITVTYYPGESPVSGTVPSGIVVISDYYWHATSADASFNNGKIITPISTLRGVTDATKLVWLKRSNSRDSWENIGGIVSGENLESLVSFNSFSEFAVGSTDPVNPLPVELTSFTAVANSNAVNLKWQTATEVNNYGFEIERCALSVVRQAWDKIGFVQGNGNSNSAKDYSFTDNKLLGGTKFQYRLKQIDSDGKYEYSVVVEVENIPTEYALYQNYPNPFNPTTKIRYQLPTESKVVIKIYNILGSEVMELLNEQNEPGIYEVEFNANNLASGTYIYKISADNFVKTKKMILIK